MKSSATQNPSLIDPFGRKIEYVRLSVTDKCNLRCFYCMPKGFKDFEQPEDWLTFEEIERVIKAFTELGVARVRLTGGEPLVRKNIAGLAQRLTALPGLDDLSLSTNAVLLDKQADALYWIDDFLQLKASNDAYHNTKDILNVLPTDIFP